MRVDLRLLRRRLAPALAAIGLTTATVFIGADEGRRPQPAHPEGIEHILVIDLENENFSATFGPGSPAVYLNQSLLRQGQLIVNYFATSHVSLGNYISQVSGQAPTPDINNDCINLGSLSNPPVLGSFTDILPGTDALDEAEFPGQVVGNGCVFPAPTPTSHGAQTIGDQLDALDRANAKAQAKVHDNGEQRGQPWRLNWRAYAEDMGDNIVRDYGTPDPTGGTSLC